MNGGRLSIALCAAVLLGAMTAAPAGAIGFLDEWGGTGSGHGELEFPVSVANDGAGHVYVADSQNDRIEKFDESGAFLDEWGGHGSGSGQFFTPEGVATDSAGNVYVVDLENARVEKFDAHGTFLAQWGSQGSEPGQLKAPEGVAVDEAGNVFVVDAVNNRVEKYSAAGAFLTQWGGFNLPEGIATDPAGNVYVADSENNRVAKFTGNGAFIADWGQPNRPHVAIRQLPTGERLDAFDFPIGIGTDSKGRVYVSDSGTDTVQKFTGGGKFLTQWGGHGAGPGQFSSPLAVAAGSGGKVFVADAANDRIQVFGPLPEPEYGKTVNVGPVSGTVRVLLPGKKKPFVLEMEMQIPVGAIVDTSQGRIRLTSAAGPAGGPQSADFFEGRFKVLQPRGGRPITVLKLENPVLCGKAGRPRATASRSRSNGLWGSGKGNFRSEGRHGSATVRGTIWWAQDRCDGTKFKVKRGVVTVRDFTNHRTLKLHRGETYLAPAA